MSRRDLLTGMNATILYGNFPHILSEFISSCNVSNKKLRTGFFSDDTFEIIEMITDTILPKIAAPGTMETQLPYFIDLVVQHCFSNGDQQLIKNGLNQLNQQTQGGFLLLSKEEQLSTIKKIEEAALQGAADKVWFRAFKKLAVIGYFTSRDGREKALQYVQVPGAFNACVPYAAGVETPAKTFLMYW